MLMKIIAVLGISLLLYSLVRIVTGIEVSESTDRNIINGVIIITLGLFMYHRKLIVDEKLAKAAEEKAKRLEEEPEEEGDESLPHWERYKKTADSKDGTD
jgi:uncharacterized membrane protein